MGFPLAPVLANIFMGFCKSKWLNEYNLDKPKFYLRYVDDILAAFDNEQDSLNFLNFLNNRHPNIKFTIEKQINHSIAFLDVFISGINNQNLTLQTYHKSTYTGLLLNFKSFTSFSYKISLIKCLIDRSFKICNNWNSFHNDIGNIKSNLIKNAHPPFWIDKSLKSTSIIRFLITKTRNILVILPKLVIILKLGLKSISKRISLIFLNIYTPPQQALTHNSPCFKIIDKANSKFGLKTKEP